MAQGKKYNNDIKEKAFAMLAVNNNTTEVARELGLPRSTVKTWKQEFERMPESAGELSLAQLRQQKKEEFVKKAWNILHNAETLIERRISRALEDEDALDTLLDEIDSGELTDKQRQSLYARFSAIKLESIRELAVVLGTLYDKQALANNEATQNVAVDIVKFEDL